MKARLSISMLLALLLAAGAAASYSWVEVEPMPSAWSGRTVKHGGWMVEEGDLFYAQKGNKTNEFYFYDPLTGTWTPLTGMPYQTHPFWGGKPPRKGSKGCAAGAFIYVTQGNNTLGFWRYHIGKDSWEILPDVPLGVSGKKVKGGTDMARVKGRGHDTGYVYLMKGYKSEMYRFNEEALTWQTLPDAPTGVKAKWGKGSWLVHRRLPRQSGDLLYAHKSKYHELWPFNVDSLTWGSRLSGMPFIGMMGRRKKSKAGGCAVFEGDYIWALKGGNTQEFWCYSVEGDSWFERDTIPAFGSTGRKRRVKYGADIVSFGDSIFFALKGNKTLELWRYTIPAAQMSTGQGRRDGIAGALKFRLALPEGAHRVKVFNTSGRLVKSASTDGRVLSGSNLGLRAGVYLVRAETHGRTETLRLLVTN